MATLHPVPAEWASRAYVDAAGYAEKYRRSLEQPDAFWREQAALVDWQTPFEQVCDHSRPPTLYTSMVPR